jgi:hypothetical protein
MDGARRRKRLVAAAPHHREHLAKGPLEAAVGVGPGLRVVRDRLRYLRMGDLQERRPAPAEEEAGVPVHLPQRRAGAEETGHRIVDLGADRGEPGLELIRAHRGGSGVDRHPFRV